jgi:hypothetical protein
MVQEMVVRESTAQAVVTIENLTSLKELKPY